MKISHNLARRRRGDMIAESVAALALLFPILVSVIYASLEASQAYVISRYMQEAADLASRQLATSYKTTPGIASSSSSQQAIYSAIRINNMVSGNSQFSSTWSTSGSPPIVTTTCTYLSGQGSPALPTFPTVDPLKLGSLFTIKASATYMLQ